MSDLLKSLTIEGKYAFFYGGFLSQWHKSPFTDSYTEVKYLCMEQYLMHNKALLFGDFDTAKEIMSKTHPKDHKALGREVKNFSDKVWNKNKKLIAYRGNLFKFSSTVELTESLLATGNKRLAEASPYDKIWGIGYTADKALSVPVGSWGENLLGKTLMNVRFHIKAMGGMT